MPRDIYMNAGLSLTGDRSSVDTGDLIVGGNVGVGTETPSGKLDVHGDVVIRNDTNATLSLYSGASNTDCLINLYEGNDLKWTLRNQGDNNDRFFIQSNVGGTEKRFTIEQEGNVGIGTSDPAVKLDVNGSMRGATEVVNQSSGAINAINCYGDTIYADTAPGTLTLPAGVVGMNLQIINDSGGAITLAVQTGEYLDGTVNGTDDLSVGGGSKPYLHKVVCAATGKWFLSHP